MIDTDSMRRSADTMNDAADRMNRAAQSMADSIYRLEQLIKSVSVSHSPNDAKVNFIPPTRKPKP